MATKLNFRARTLDAAKPLDIYFLEDLPELTDLNAISRWDSILLTFCSFCKASSFRQEAKCYGKAIAQPKLVSKL